MKKILTATALALVLSTSVMANPSQSDMDQVFGNQTTTEKFSQLSSNEMQETKGEYWNVILRIILSTRSQLRNPGYIRSSTRYQINNTIY